MSSSPSPATASAIRVATFNTQHGVDANGDHRFDRTLDAVRSLDADVVALQEVDVRTLRSRFANQARRLANAAGATFVFGPSARVQLVGRMGNALLVRGVVHEAATVRLPRSGRSTPRSVVFAAVEVGGVAFSVAATHLSIAREEATQQLGAVCSWIASQRDERWLLVGDLNLRPPDVDAIVGAVGLTRAVGSPSRPSVAARFEIDHIAARGFALSPATAIPCQASDHLPVVATATVRP